MVSNPGVCMVKFGVNEDSACCKEAIVDVGDAGVVGGWTITPDTRDTVTSDVAGLVVCVVRLNEAKGEGGFAGNFVEVDPAMAVF